MCTCIKGKKNIHLDLNPWWWVASKGEVEQGVNSLKYGDIQDFIRENNLVEENMGLYELYRHPFLFNVFYLLCTIYTFHCILMLFSSSLYSFKSCSVDMFNVCLILRIMWTKMEALFWVSCTE